MMRPKHPMETLSSPRVIAIILIAVIIVVLIRT
jgi:hypothetical protein